MNGKKAKRLRRVARELSPITESEVIRTLGADLIKNGVTEDITGQRILPKKYYTQQARKPVKHARKVKQAYLSGGNDAVIDYGMGVERQVQKWKQEAEKQAEKRNKEEKSESKHKGTFF